MRAQSRFAGDEAQSLWIGVLMLAENGVVHRFDIDP